MSFPIERELEPRSIVGTPHTTAVCSRVTLWCWFNHQECWPNTPYTREIPPRVRRAREQALRRILGQDRSARDVATSRLTRTEIA